MGEYLKNRLLLTRCKDCEKLWWDFFLAPGVQSTICGKCWRKKRFPFWIGLSKIPSFCAQKVAVFGCQKTGRPNPIMENTFCYQHCPNIMDLKINDLMLIWNWNLHKIPNSKPHGDFKWSMIRHHYCMQFSCNCDFTIFVLDTLRGGGWCNKESNAKIIYKYKKYLYLLFFLDIFWALWSLLNPVFNINLLDIDIKQVSIPPYLGNISHKALGQFWKLRVADT